MHEFHGARVTFLQIDTGNTRIEHLLEELVHVGTAFVPHPCRREQASLITRLENAIAKVDVLAKAHFRETAQLIIYIPTHTHIERARIELVEFLLATANTARREERSHGIADCLLHLRKRVMRTVGTAERLTWMLSQFCIHRLEIILRQHHVGIQYQHIIAFRTLHAIIARRAWTRIGLCKILDVELILIFFHHLFTWRLRAILHDDYFELEPLHRLLRQTFQQFIRLIGTIINRNYD